MKESITSVIILSTGRTGTMFFAKLLKNLIPQADVYHEAGERSRLINIFTHIHLSGFAPLNLPLYIWKRVVSPDLQSCTQKYYIDSNNHIYAFVPLQPHLYPNLKVVHLVRDPRSYVRSHINWSRHRLKSFIANYLIPFWQPNAFLMKEMSLGNWVGLSTFERFCWIWDFKNRFIGNLEDSDYPYLRVKFENFFESSEPSFYLNKILHFMGIPELYDLDSHFSHPINPNKGLSFPAWQTWSVEQCQRLQDHCGKTMKAYGYGQESTWFKKLNMGIN
jgi:hypothetical protein